MLLFDAMAALAAAMMAKTTNVDNDNHHWCHQLKVNVYISHWKPEKNSLLQRTKKILFKSNKNIALSPRSHCRTRKRDVQRTLSTINYFKHHNISCFCSFSTKFYCCYCYCCCCYVILISHRRYNMLVIWIMS